MGRIDGASPQRSGRSLVGRQIKQKFVDVVERGERYSDRDRALDPI